MYILVLHTKGGLISERSSLKSQKNMSNLSPEHYPPKENMEYREGFGTFFWTQNENFLRLSKPLVLLRLNLVFFELNESVQFPV